MHANGTQKKRILLFAIMISIGLKKKAKEDNFRGTAINAPIDNIAETIASTSKTASASSPDGMISFRGPSSQIYRKGTLMPTATFEACKLY